MWEQGDLSLLQQRLSRCRWPVLLLAAVTPALDSGKILVKILHGVCGSLHSRAEAVLKARALAGQAWPRKTPLPVFLMQIFLYRGLGAHRPPPT